jgi:plasmid segregation protein ParM
MDTKAFMTKTEYIDRKDTPPREDIYLIAIDIGYSAVKVISENIAAMFPSYALPDNGMGTAGTLTNDYIRYQDLDTGARWFVGKMALDSLSDDDTSVSESSLYRRDRYNDPMFRVITEAGIGLACMRDKKDSFKQRKICVETGLPPRYITKGSYDCDSMIDVISGKHHFSLQIGQNEPMEFNLLISTDSIHIMPQPMGTLFSAAVGNDHRMLPIAADLLNKNVMIFDGGFGTLDLYPIKAHVIQQSETYDNLGMKRVLEETTDVIRERFRKDISVPAMQKYLESGNFRWFEAKSYSTKEEPLGKILEECCRLVCDEAIEKAFQVYHVYEYDYLIVTGGTGAAWFEQINEKLKNMETLKIVSGSQNDSLPGVFSNVRGYYMFRYSDLASRKE